MGKARQGQVHSLELAPLNNSRGLWAIGVVSSCLVPGSWDDLGHKTFSLMSES